MQVLIAAGEADLAELWARHLRRGGATVVTTTSQDTAADYLSARDVDVVVIDLVLSDGSAVALADFASYRRPDARIVFVTSRTFFSDGSIFDLAPNAATCLRRETPPADMAAIVEYYGKAG